MIKPSEVSIVANEAVDQLQVAREYMAWFDSLNYAITDSLKKWHGDHAAQLASVAQYLAVQCARWRSVEHEPTPQATGAPGQQNGFHRYRMCFAQSRVLPDNGYQTVHHGNTVDVTDLPGLFQ